MCKNCQENLKRFVILGHFVACEEAENRDLRARHHCSQGRWSGGVCLDKSVALALRTPVGTGETDCAASCPTEALRPWGSVHSPDLN